MVKGAEMEQFNPNQNISPVISLEAIHIARPCRADWDQMTGDDRARHCALCHKNVYNLSAMTRDEAQRLILEKEGKICVQLHRRADGTVLTSDCPVGITEKRRGARWLVVGVAALMGAVLSLAGMGNSVAAQKCLNFVGAQSMAQGSSGVSRGEMGDMVIRPVATPTPAPAATPTPKPTAKPQPAKTPKPHATPQPKS